MIVNDYERLKIGKLSNNPYNQHYQCHYQPATIKYGDPIIRNGTWASTIK